MKLIEILHILKKYMTNNQWYDPVWAEHDIIGFNVDQDLISQEDLETLYEFGVFFDDMYGSLIIFV